MTLLKLISKIIQQIISKHKQAYIPTAIYQTITKKILNYLHFLACLRCPSCYMPPTSVESCHKNTIDYI